MVEIWDAGVLRWSELWELYSSIGPGFWVSLHLSNRAFILTSSLQGSCAWSLSDAWGLGLGFGVFGAMAVGQRHWYEFLVSSLLLADASVLTSSLVWAWSLECLGFGRGL